MTIFPSLWLLVAALGVAGALVGGLVARAQRNRTRARARQMLDPQRNREGIARLEERLSELDGRFTKVDTERRELLRTQRELNVLIETRELELSASQDTLREKSEALAALARDQELLNASLSEQRQLADRAQARTATLESEHQLALKLLAEQRARALELERSAADAQKAAHHVQERMQRELRAPQEELERERLESSAKLAVLAAQVGEREAELQALARALTEIRDTVAAREHEAGELRSALANYKGVADAATERCGELERRVEDLRGELARETVAAQARTAQDGVRLRELEALVSSLREQLAAAAGRADEAQAQLACSEAIASAQTACADQLTAQAEQLQQQVAELAERLRESKVEQLRVNAALEQQTLQSNERSSGLERSLAERAAELSRLERELQARTTELASTTQSAHGLQARQRELQEAKDALTVKANELQAQLDELQAASNERIAHLGERLSERVAEASHLDSELRARSEELARASTRAEAAERSAREAEQLRHGLDAQLRALQAQSTHSAAAANEQITSLEHQLAERESDVARMVGELEARRDALALQSSVREGAQARCSELEAELQLRTEHLTSAQRRVVELETHLTARVSELQGHIDGCDRELERRAHALAAARGELDERRAQVASTEQRSAALSAQLEALGQRLADQTSSQAALAHESELQRAALAERYASESSAAEQRAEQLRARIESLERALAERDGQLAQQQDERRALGELSAELETALANRALELVEREQLLSGVRSEIETLAADVERWRANAALEKNSLDELASVRLTAILGRRGASGADALPEAYLEGLAERDLAAAVRGLLGEPQPLSSTSFERLAEHWAEQHATWRAAPLEREVVYLWLDGLRVKAGLPNEDDSLLLAVAGLDDGSKAVVAVESGARASAEAWSAVLEQLRARRMTTPRIVVADAELGAWEALRSQGFDGARQLCWGYELGALVSPMPERSRARATQILRRIVNAPERAKAIQARSAFLESYSKRCPPVAERLSKHWRELTAYYAFPEDHWVHLRSTTAVSTALEALRLAGGGAKPALSTPHAVAILWRLLIEAERRGRRLNASHKLAEVAQASPGKARRRAARA